MFTHQSVSFLRFILVLSVLALCFCNVTLAQTWHNGDVITYSQPEWGNSVSTAGVLLEATYDTVFGSTFGVLEVGIPGAGGFSMRFTSTSPVFAYLPQAGSIGALVADLTDPTGSSSGVFGGAVTSLALNVALSDAGVMVGTSGAVFGDLTMCGYMQPGLNGQSVRSFLATASSGLGGGPTPYSLADLYDISESLDGSFEGGTVSQYAQEHLKRPWHDGDVISYSQPAWGTMVDPAGVLLAANFNSVFAPNFGVMEMGIPGAAGFSIQFTSASALFGYLPQGAPIGALNADLLDPITSSSGVFGGAVSALVLNVAFSDAGYLVGASGVRFGDLILYGYAQPGLNGQSVRSFLATASIALGGGATPYSLADLYDISESLDGSFEGGTVSQYAQEHLKLPWHNGDVVTYSQESWGNQTHAAGQTLFVNYDNVFASTSGLFEVGISGSGGFSMAFTSANAVLAYLPASGPAGSLTTDIGDPTSTSSGAYGGDVTALAINVVFSDMGVTLGTAGVRFGDLTVYGLSSPFPDVNGRSVRQLLAIASMLLGGGGAGPYSVDDLQVVATLLNSSFEDGVPSQFAREHLTANVQHEPDLTINDITQNELNSGSSNFTFTVSLSAPAGAGGVTFAIATANNTATTADNDYVLMSLTNQTIPQGNSTYTFDITINGDLAVEPDETFFVNVTNVTGATVVDGQGLGTITNDDVACPHSRGYWKSNSAAWPVSALPMRLGTSRTYTKPQLLTILNMPVGCVGNADASLILADQLIAAKLNIAAGAAAPVPVPATITAADAAIAGDPIPINPKIKPSTPRGRTMVSLAFKLVAYNSGTLNHGCGTLPKSTQDSDESLFDVIPESFGLEQNHPNPFNPSTTISYDIPADGRVSLTVYNYLGQEVAVLVDEIQDAGYKSVTWDASNEPSGVYFYRIVATSGRTTFTDVRKMLVVK